MKTDVDGRRARRLRRRRRAPRERYADLDEEEPPEDDVEQLEEDVQDDEGAERDDGDVEAANPTEPQTLAARRAGLALEKAVGRVPVEKVLQALGDGEGHVGLHLVEKAVVARVG